MTKFYNILNYKVLHGIETMNFLIKLIENNASESSQAIDLIPQFCETIKSQIHTEVLWQECFETIVNNSSEMGYVDYCSFLEKMEEQVSLLTNQLRWLKVFGEIYQEENPLKVVSGVEDVIGQQKRLLNAQENLSSTVFRKFVAEIYVSSRLLELGDRLLELENSKQEIQRTYLSFQRTQNDRNFSSVQPPSENDLKNFEPAQNTTNSPNSIVSADQELVDQYNSILQATEDDFARLRNINESWSPCRRMSVASAEAVRSGQDAELTEDQNGSYFCIFRNSSWLVFPIPSISLQESHIKAIFDIENDGDFIENVVREAQFEETQNLLRIKTRGLINAKPRRDEA